MTRHDDTWTVHPGGAIPFSLAPLYSDARQRVLASRRLRDYVGSILQCGLASDEAHLRWVCEAAVAEIEEWAKAEHARREDEINALIFDAERLEERRAEL